MTTLSEELKDALGEGICWQAKVGADSGLDAKLAHFTIRVY